MKPFILMITFLTRIPLKTNFEIKDDDFKRGIWYIPVVGIIIGAILFAINLAISSYVSPLINSVIIVTAYIVLTGALHIDGLADTADAIYSYRDRERMLEIMKDSRIGTFGVVGILVYVLIMVALLTKVPEACLVFPLVARSCSVLASSISKYARKSGMGKVIIEKTKFWHVIFSYVLFVVLVTVVYLVGKNVVVAISAAVSVVFCTLITLIITRSISKKLGGITGDVIGYIIEITSVFYVLAYYVSTIILGHIS